MMMRSAPVANGPNTSPNRRRWRMAAGVSAAVLALTLTMPAAAQVTTSGQSFQGTPTINSGNAAVNQTASLDTITINSSEAVITWTPNDRTGTGTIDFLPFGRSARFTGAQEFTVLNRIVPLDGNDIPILRMVALNGIITSDVNGGAGGSVWFYSPGGLLVGSNAIINVGSLVLTTRDIDTTGGLFGQQGEIRFRNPAIAAANSRIEIQQGAGVYSNRTDGRAYMALVAPRIEQRGTILADGSIALVAAEVADVRINSGLFDINVFVGSSDPNGIVHTGTTGGPSDHTAGYDSRAYLVAVPQAQAMTMLLSGTLGFQDAQSATVTANGGIVLAAGNNVGNGLISGPVGNSDASIRIGDTLFLNDLIATATNSVIIRPDNSCQPALCSLTSPFGAVRFNDRADIFGGRLVDVSVGQGQQITAASDLALSSFTPGIGGTVRVGIDTVAPPTPNSFGRGSISVTGTLKASASATGVTSVNDGTATGGNVTVNVNGGDLSAGAISLDANGVGGLTTASTGANGFGGTVSMTAANTGTISAGSADLSANGSSNPYVGAGGNGRGGTATVAALTGGRIGITTSLSAFATGEGGIGSDSSGNGTGGSVFLNVTGTNSGIIAGSTTLDASGLGGGNINQLFDFQSQTNRTTTVGGVGAGGSVSITNTAVTLGLPGTNLGALTARAEGVGGESVPFTGGGNETSSGPVPTSGPVPMANALSPLGGNGVGGTINVTLTGSTTTSSNTIFSVNASGGRSGNASGTTGTATAGAITIEMTGGASWSVRGDLSVAASAAIDASGRGAVALADAGSIRLALDNANLDVLNQVTLYADAFSFAQSTNAFASTSSDALGGDVTLSLTNASMSADRLVMSASATARDATGPGGRGVAGTVTVGAEGGSSLTIVSSSRFVATGVGGSGLQGGAGTGGIIDIGVFDSTVQLGASSEFDVIGLTGGTFASGQDTTAGRGGTVRFTVSGAQSLLSAGNIFAVADGGVIIGAEGSLPGQSATGGHGGDILFNFQSGTVDFTSAIFSANGVGSLGGDGEGGTIVANFDGADVDIDFLTIYANGAGSDSAADYGAGAGRGGSVTLNLNAGNVTFGFTEILANGIGGTGGVEPSGVGGTGGGGDGGSIEIIVDGATFAVTGDLFAGANGTGGEGGTTFVNDFQGSNIYQPPGTGATGSGGSVTFTMRSGIVDDGADGPASIRLQASGIGGRGGDLNIGGSSQGGFQLPNNSDNPRGGDGLGGVVTLNLIGGTFVANASLDSTGTGGIGGYGLRGGDGGNGTGGVSRVVINGFDASDAGFTLISEGYGGRGTDGQNGDGGNGGNGTGGAATFEVTGTGALGTIFAPHFIVNGRGGNGGTGGVSPFAANPVTTGFRGGNGGVGRGGTASANAFDGGTLQIGGDGSVALISALGIGGNGGGGSGTLQGPTVPTFGGNGGSGGNAFGGTIILFAEGGRITLANSAAGTLQLRTGATEGIGGAGGLGNIIPILDTQTGQIIGFQGGNGGGGPSGLSFGGRIRFEAADSTGLDGDIDIDNVDADASAIIGGRIELIDRSAARGIRFGNATLAAFGGPITSSDFTVIGSGIYLFSDASPIIIDGGANFQTDGNIQFDATGSGGIDVGGTFDIFAGLDVIGNHADRTSEFTVNGGEVRIFGGSITFNDGSLVLADNGVSFTSGTFITFDHIELLSGAGSFDAGTTITGFTVNATDNVTFDSGGGTDIENARIDGSATATAGGRIRFGSLTTGGFATLTGNGVTVDSGNIGATFTVFGQNGDIIIGNATAQDTTRLNTLRNIRIGSLTTTGTGAFMTLESGLDLNIGTLTGSSNISIVTGTVSFDTGTPSFIFANGALSIGATGNVSLGDATGNGITISTPGALTYDFLRAPSMATTVTAGSISGGYTFGNAGVFLTSTSGNIVIGDVDSNATIDILSNGILTFRDADGGEIYLDASGTITGRFVDAHDFIVATSTNGNVAIADIIASEDITLSALRGNVTGSSAESIFGGITIDAINVDYGSLAASFTIDIDAAGNVDIDFAETDPSASQGAGTGSGAFGLTAMASNPSGSSDIDIAAGGTVTLGTLISADNIFISAAVLAGATSSLTAFDVIELDIDGNAVFGSLTANDGIDVDAGGTITGTSAETLIGGNIFFDGEDGVGVTSVTSVGTTSLLSRDGGVSVGNLQSVGNVTAAARTVLITGTGPLTFARLDATAGDASVTSNSGPLSVLTGTVSGAAALRTLGGTLSLTNFAANSMALTGNADVAILGTVTAGTSLDLVAPGTATVTGIATGGTIRFRSGDVVIGSTGRIGTAGTTTSLTLENSDTTARTFIGGNDQANEYSLSAAEMARLFGGNVTIIAPRVTAQGQPSLGSTRPPDVVIGAFTFTGGGAASGNLGSNGTLSIQTTGSARVIGAVQMNNMNALNGLELIANDAIEVILGQGSIRLSGSGSNSLGGILTLVSDDIAVASTAAITDIAGMSDIALIDGRLAANDGTTDDTGALAADTIRFDAINGVYVQNSGTGTGFADRRGFTANTLEIFTESSSTRIVINGRVGNATNVLQTGIDAIAFSLINGAHPLGQGQFAVGSTINGCSIAAPASCRNDSGPSFPVQDTINQTVRDDDDENGEDVTPSILIDIREVDDLTDQPILDEPITGTGNDDLWIPADGPPADE